MNPSSTLRFRRVTAALAITWALIGLLLGVTGELAESRRPAPPFTYSGVGGKHVIHQVTPEAAASGVEPGDQLLAVDGEPASWWLRAGRHDRSPGRANRYRTRKPDGTEREVSLAPLPPGSAPFAFDRLLGYALFGVGALYLMIALLVFRLRSERHDAWALLLFCSAMATQLFLSGPLSRVGALLSWSNVALIGATAFHLFTTFPLEPQWIVRRPGLRVIPYGIAAALGSVVLAERALSLPPGLGPNLALGFTLVTVTGCVLSLGFERWRNRIDPGVDRANVMLLGAVLAFFPAGAALVVHWVFGSPFPWYAGMLGVFLFPAAIGYGIVRNQLFEIRLAARSSAAYGVVTLAITGLFALSISFADLLFERFNVNARSPAFSVAFLFLAILFFNPVRNRIQRVVDAFFDRDRVAYGNAVREISEAMVSMLSVKEIVDRILVALTDTMGVERAMVLLIDDDEHALAVVASRGDWDDDFGDLDLSADHPVCRHLWTRRHELARSDFDDEQDPELREACRDVFDSLDAALLVPILYGVELLGVIAVGRKLTGDRLGSDDRQLLRTLANQSSIAIENAKAFDEIAKLNETLEARVEERTDQLRHTQAQLVQSEKMRTLGQLVAGVAHELNNPIGFVHANLQLLGGYVSKLESDDPATRDRAEQAINQLLARSREGTVRVKEIVQNLKLFSRMDQAELQDADLNEEIERTLALADQRFKDRISVERDYGELPRVRCFAGQLNQVFMNLVINACDAIEGKGCIRVKTRAIDDGVRLEFADDGPGLPEELAERIFEPFFTTKAVGKGTGLGLSLSHGIIERHGGRMWVESEPGEGATFVIALPRVAQVLEEDPGLLEVPLS